MPNLTNPMAAQAHVSTEPASNTKAPVDELRGADIAFRDLSNAALAGRDLTGANLFNAKLVGADLRNARLDDADLTGADLSGADLTGASLIRAGLGKACLADAHLFEASMTEATLTLADLSSADLRCTRLDGARMRDANLTNADLTYADLCGAELSLCQVAGAHFDNADLRHARLRNLAGFDKARWRGCDIRDINFAGGYLLRRFIIDQNYLTEFQHQSRRNRWIYALWSLTSDCGRSATRWLGCIVLQILLFAFLYQWVALDLGGYPSPISTLYFSVVTLTTLGFGDVVPASTAAQIIVMGEVLTGYMMLGGLLSIFTNKMSRRGE